MLPHITSSSSSSLFDELIPFICIWITRWKERWRFRQWEGKKNWCKAQGKNQFPLKNILHFVCHCSPQSTWKGDENLQKWWWLLMLKWDSALHEKKLIYRQQWQKVNILRAKFISWTSFFILNVRRYSFFLPPTSASKEV